jgi:dTDP-4-amino-4,6-dideoxygalactose transaminase
MATDRIPFNRAGLAGNEFRYISEALAELHVCGGGRFTAQCQALLEQELGVRRALLTTSCTHALEMAALLLDIGPGDEVILPSFTFVSTANAFVLRGARPVFVDIRRDTLNLDETRLERLITRRTRGVVAVHYAGVACEMDAILDTAARHGLPVVEDNAHGLFAKYHGRPLGSLGVLATLSFHETKNLTCGEGGALLVNDATYFERADVIRDKGTNRGSFDRGEVDRYTWVDVGSSYLPSEILAAFLYAQLEERERIQRERRRIWQRYQAELEPWARERGVGLPVVPSHCEQSFHMFYLILPSAAERESLIAHLSAAGILAVFHYVPLHLSAMGRRFGYAAGDFPVTEDLSARLLRWPFYHELTEADQALVVAEIKRWPQRYPPALTAADRETQPARISAPRAARNRVGSRPRGATPPG